MMPSLIGQGRRMEHLLSTESTDDQEEAEEECKPFFVNLKDLNDGQIAHLRSTGLLSISGYDVCLLYEQHASYLSKAFGVLSAGFVSLDASRPWIIYWTLHSCDLIGELPPEDTRQGILSTLQACWQGDNSMGGFGGSPGQMAHCATTYAAILALCILATEEGGSATQAREYLARIKPPLLNWYSSLQQPNGGYRMHLDGEIDIRATYCILACATLLNICYGDLASPRVIHFLQDCQTFEGGFGGEPGSEAHGGYTFCATAALQILGKLQDIDLEALEGWLVRRQMSYEGGFQGRTNKLVDGCYSFWQGGAMAILAGCGKQDPWLQPETDAPKSLLMDEGMLQRYILLCAQDVNGGLRDKPSKTRDFYHSCYNLSGLSVSQHYASLAFGHPSSTLVAKTHPVYNLRIDRVEKVLKYFA